jgi:hypothetical protein
MAKKIPWEEKYRRIVSQYPEVVDVNWSELLRSDGDVFARLLGDVLKSGSRGSKPGKRPTLDRREALERLAKVGDEDFSEFGFHETFSYLTQGTSIRGVAAKTGLGKSYVQRLLAQDTDPSFAVMEQIAKAYKKHPSYFLEYRIAKTLVVIDSLLHDSPETATAWYLKFAKVKT